MLYTNQIKDPEQKRQAQNFKALRGTSFRTASFQYKEQSEVRHREARQDSDNGLWAVYETAIKPDIEAGLNQTGGFNTKKEEMPVLKNVCVLDALHNCALFEKIDIHDHILTASNSEIPYYEDFAAKEGITFDQQNKPHLPRPGQKKISTLQKYMVAPQGLLTNTISLQQLRQETKEKAAKSKIEQTALMHIQKEEQKITKRAEKFTNKFYNCTNALTKLTDSFENTQEYGYRSFATEGEWRFHYDGLFGNKEETGLGKCASKWIGSGSVLGAPMGGAFIP